MNTFLSLLLRYILVLFNLITLLYLSMVIRVVYKVGHLPLKGNHTLQWWNDGDLTGFFIPMIPLVLLLVGAFLNGIFLLKKNPFQSMVFLSPAPVVLGVCVLAPCVINTLKG